MLALGKGLEMLLAADMCIIVTDSFDTLVTIMYVVI